MFQLHQTSLLTPGVIQGFSRAQGQNSNNVSKKEGPIILCVLSYDKTDMAALTPPPPDCKMICNFLDRRAVCEKFQMFQTQSKGFRQLLQMLFQGFMYTK